MKEQNLEKYLSGGDCSVAEAMAQIDRNAKGIVFVADEEKHLLGSVTDGDIRRWLIRTGNLAAKISQAMNPRPRYLLNGNTQKAAEYMKENVIGAVPVLDADRRIIDIIFGTDGFLRKQKKRNTLAGRKRGRDSRAGRKREWNDRTGRRREWDSRVGRKREHGCKTGAAGRSGA